MPKGLRIGFGFTIYKHNTPIILVEPVYSKLQNIGNNLIVYNSKLEAITKALEYTCKITKERNYFNIFTDN